MGLVQDVEVKAAAWVFKEELPGAIQTGAAAVVGLLASGKAAAVLATLGITIDPAKLGNTLVTLGTALATAAVTHLTASWAISKATAPSLAKPSLELQADRPSPLAPKDTEAPLK